MSLNGHKSAQMSLNKSKKTWMNLNKLKWAIMGSNESIWAQNEPKGAQMGNPINELKKVYMTSNEP